MKKNEIDFMQQAHFNLGCTDTTMIHTVTSGYGGSDLFHVLVNLRAETSPFSSCIFFYLGNIVAYPSWTRYFLHLSPGKA